MRRIELNVGRAEPHELVHLFAEDLGDVAEKGLQRVVRGGGLGRVPEIREQARAGQRHLHDPVGPASGVGELLGGEEALAPQLAHHPDARAFDSLLAELVALPVTPKERVQVPFAEAFDRVGELALE